MLPDGTTLLYSISGIHCLLQDGQPKLIGQTYNAKRILSDRIEIQMVVKFHYGNKGINDLFVFENEMLVFHSISPVTEAFMTDLYKDLLKNEIISPGQIIDGVTEMYTLKKMGF